MSSSITTDTTDSTGISPGNSRKTDRAAKWVWRSVFGGWAALIGLVAYVEAVFWLRTVHPPCLPLAALLLALVASLLCLLWNAARLSIRRSGFAIAGLLLGLAPVGLLAWPLAYAASQWSSARSAPNNRLKNFAMVFGAVIMHAEARRAYPYRLESDRIVMFYDDAVKTPHEDLAAMDRHVADLEQRLGRKLREKIWLVRGPVLWQSGISFLGLSLGSADEPAADGHLDRHELAHGVIEQFVLVESDPPSLLKEGWAEANSGYSDAEAAGRALDIRTEFPELTLRKLVSDEWYYRHDHAIYPVGGAFARYFLRRFGHAKFLEVYVRSRRGGFRRMMPLVLGVDFDTLERDFWSDAERTARVRRPVRLSQDKEGVLAP